MKIRKKYLIPLITAILASLLAITSLASSVTEDTGGLPTIDPDRTGSVTIDYKEDTDGKEGISGAVFTFYKIAAIGPSGEYVPLTDETAVYDRNTRAEDIEQDILAAYAEDASSGFRKSYTTTTNGNGMAECSGMEQGLYLAVETTPAENHFSSISFLVSLPYVENNVWKYSVTVEPKSVPAGNLVIEKTVEGNSGEMTRDFHFTVTFEYDGRLRFTKSDGTTGTIVSGDTLTLASGQNIRIDTIPAGIAYQVEEKEANQEGYATEVTGGSGNIRMLETQKASFVNTRNTTNKPTDNVSTNDTKTVYVAGSICLFAFLMFLLLLYKKKQIADGQ